MTLRTRWPLLLTAAALAGCVLEKSRAEIEAEDKAAGKTFASPPPMPRRAPAVETAAIEPGSLDRLIALDDSARRFPADPRAPGWLYEAGVEGTRHEYVSPATSSDSAQLAAMPGAFRRHLFEGGQRYTGWHLRELVARFPADTLADDAAFLVARYQDFEENDCEGYLDCLLAEAIDPYSHFLRAHPASPLVAVALVSSDSAMRTLVDAAEAGQVEFVAVDTLVADSTQQRAQVENVDATLAAFEAAISALPPADRDRAMASFELIRERWRRLRGPP